MIKVGDIVEHTVYGLIGMVERLYEESGANYATMWLFDSNERGEQDRRAKVSVRYLKPFVAYVET
jgi:hypothetical protein